MNDYQLVWKNHSNLYQRLRKSFYYGHTKKPIERSSLPLTEVTVNLIYKSIGADQQSLNILDVNYASHVLQGACISPASIMIAMIYLDRLKASNSSYIRQSSPCELFLVSLMIASKFLFDKGENESVYNDEWASIANLDIEDLNKVELEFLSALNWSCFVDHPTFMKQLVKFEALISLNEFSKRQSDNTITYYELISLFKYLQFKYPDSDLLWSDIKEFTKVIAILSLAYCAAIGVMLASFSIVFSFQAIIVPTTTGTMNTTLDNINYVPNHTPEANNFEYDLSKPSADKPTLDLFKRNFTNGYLMYADRQVHKYNKMLKC